MHHDVAIRLIKLYAGHGTATSHKEFFRRFMDFFLTTEKHIQKRIQKFPMRHQ